MVLSRQQSSILLEKMTLLVSALLLCGLNDLSAAFFSDSLLNGQGGEYGLTLWSISETFVIIFTGCLPTLKPLWDDISSKKSSCTSSGTEPSRHLSDAYFAQQQGYQMFSMASPTKDGPLFHDNMHGKGLQRGIRATTQIDVSPQSV